MPSTKRTLKSSFSFFFFYPRERETGTEITFILSSLFLPLWTLSLAQIRPKLPWLERERKKQTSPQSHTHNLLSKHKKTPITTLKPPSTPLPNQFPPNHTNKQPQIQTPRTQTQTQTHHNHFLQNYQLPSKPTPPSQKGKRKKLDFLQSPATIYKPTIPRQEPPRNTQIIKAQPPKLLTTPPTPSLAKPQPTIVINTQTKLKLKKKRSIATIQPVPTTKPTITKRISECWYPYQP